MTFSFLKLLGLDANKTSSFLIINNNFLIAVQLGNKKGKFVVSGYNEIELDGSVMKEGAIWDTNSFQEVLIKLFKEAKPNSIKTDTIYINIPFEVIYPFLKDFSGNTTEEIAERSIDDIINNNSPIPLSDLSLHTKFHKNHIFTYGVIAVPKHWENQLLEVCKNVGIKNCKFIPEPYIRTTFKTDDDVNDFTLFSFHKDRVFVSIFHNKILYDSYFLMLSLLEGKPNCPVCFKEFLTGKDDLKNKFSIDIKDVYFIGFPREFHNHIGAFLDSQDLNCNFIDETQSTFNKLFKTELNRATLIGLLQYVLSKKIDFE
ncbi:hypothetical protein JW758_02515 [Candidatus Peregrinibacteria bacterium]|nr:hypothetical protein [Candidatus Peregrinibacteria bacterium]